MKLETTLPLTSLKNQYNGSRLFPLVQPSMMLKARNKFQSAMFFTRVAKRSWLNFPVASN